MFYPTILDWSMAKILYAHHLNFFLAFKMRCHMRWVHLKFSTHPPIFAGGGQMLNHIKKYFGLPKHLVAKGVWQLFYLKILCFIPWFHLIFHVTKSRAYYLCNNVVLWQTFLLDNVRFTLLFVLITYRPKVYNKQFCFILNLSAPNKHFKIVTVYLYAFLFSHNCYKIIPLS